jgi:hypothetical protein
MERAAFFKGERQGLYQTRGYMNQCLFVERQHDADSVGVPCPKRPNGGRADPILLPGPAAADASHDVARPSS